MLNALVKSAGANGGALPPSPGPKGANEMLVNNSSLPLMRFMAASMSNMIGDTRLDAASTIAGSTLARFLGVGLGAILQGALPPLLRLPQRGRD